MLVLGHYSVGIYSVPNPKLSKTAQVDEAHDQEGVRLYIPPRLMLYNDVKLSKWHTVI